MAKRLQGRGLLCGGWGSSAVALNYGSIQRPPPFDLRDGFDAGSDGRRAALVDPPSHEIIQAGEELSRESHGDLLTRHAESIPEWYSATKLSRCGAFDIARFEVADGTEARSA